MPPRIVVVWCPDWPVVAARRAGPAHVAWPADAPVAVVHANRVVAASAAARADGVVPGLRRRAAQARCPTLVLAPHDPARDAVAFADVLRVLEALTPRLELTVPGTCTFAARGPSRYHGGDHPLAARAAELVHEVLGDAVAATGPAGVGLADGAFTAAVAARWAVTHGRPALVVPSGGAATFLAPFPVRLLTEVAEVAGDGAVTDLAGLVELLDRLGLSTLGQVAALPAGDVSARFGPLGARAHRVASGLDDRPPGAGPAPPDLVEEVAFEPPVHEMGPVVFTAKALADQLTARLGHDGVVATRVTVTFETEHGEHLARTWHREGGFAAAALVERVRWQLDGWVSSSRAPTGGVTLVRLVPEEVVVDHGRQLGFWGGRPDLDERAIRAVARLASLAGPEAVTVPAWRGGRMPDEVLVPVPALTAELVDRESHVVPPAGTGPWPGRLPAPSPAVVHAERRTAEVHDGYGRPVGVSGRGTPTGAPATCAVGGGPARAVVAWAGPWPLEERWWDPATTRRRARFQLLCDDGGAHVAVVEAGQWWIECSYE